MMHSLLMALENTGYMAWNTVWALVFGFGISATLQVFVSKEQMGRHFGQTNLRSMTLATGFGAASSSCSYAAAAAARSAFSQGAALIPSLAFMFASTNLVLELGAVVWLILGWRFFLAEIVGSFVLIGLMWLLARLLFPKDLEADARRHLENAESEDADSCCHGHEDHDSMSGSSGKWQALASAFVMDWQMLWKEILIGFLIAGFLASLVPDEAWKSLFLQTGPGWLRLLENAVVGPVIAIASFVCSVGNIPLASVLWSGGISFGGVLSFIYADLLVLPLIAIYRKSYGNRAAAYISVIFFASMAGAGILVDLLFAAAGLIPSGRRPHSILTMHAGISWNYTTWLNLLAFLFAAWLLYLRRAGKPSKTHR